MQMIGAGILGVMLMAATAAHAASATNVLFDFTRVAPDDRQHHFGEHNPGGFDDNSNDDYWQVQGGVRIQAQGLEIKPWVVLNDPEPDTVNATAPSGQEVLMGKELTLRTRITQLSSGTIDDEASVGFLFGLNGDGDSTADGFLATVVRIPGGTANDSILRVNTFTDGARAGELNSVTGFEFGTDDFLELVVSDSTYELNLIPDSEITGSGNDTNRLLSADFDTATPRATLTGSLSGYEAGWVGIYFEDTGAAGHGIVNLGNFYADLVTPAAGTVVSIK